MYPVAIACGISPADFWNMGMDEIADVTIAYKRKRDYAERTEIERLFVLAEAISTRVAFRLCAHENESPDGKILMPWDSYPEMFADDKEKYEQMQYARDLEEYKERRREYAKLVANRRK